MNIAYDNKGITTVAKEQEMPIGEIIKGGNAYEVKKQRDIVKGNY